MQGWLKLHRKILESQVFSDPDLLRLWILLICRANYRPSFFRGREIGVGQVAFSQRLFCDSLGVSKGKLHRDLTKLKAAGMITIEAGREFSVASICNWETYQGADIEERGTDGALMGRTGGADGSLPKKLTIQEPPPPTPSLCEADEGGWQRVAEELRLIGVSRADDAVATAQARRLSVSDVRTLIAEWQGNAGAWGVGALYQRLTGQMSAWPPAAADYTRARAREASLRNHEAVVAERLAGERRQQADDELFAERDARHRSTIEAMKPEEVDAALDNPALVRIHRERGRSSRMVRERLFDAIERGGATAEVVAAN